MGNNFKLYILVHQKTINILIFILLYLLFLDANLPEILASCSPTPVEPGVSACLEAQQLAMEDLQKKQAAKLWITKKLQTVTSNGTEGDFGSGTVIKDDQAYTVQILQLQDDKGTSRLSIDCVRGALEKK